MEKRQGLKIGCPEEIAWRSGLIKDYQLENIGKNIGKSKYGQYLLNLLQEDIQNGIQK